MHGWGKKIVVGMVIAVYFGFANVSLAALGGIVTGAKATAVVSAPGAPVAEGGLRMLFTEKEVKTTILEELDKAFGIAVANGLQMMSRKLAHELALKVAQGGPGLRSLTEPRTLETLGQDVAGAAAGEFLGSFSQAFFGDAGFLCNPDPNFQLAVTIGMLGTEDPQPKCDWREVQSNYKALAAQNQTEWLNRLSASFSPAQSDAGAMLFSINRLSEYKNQAVKLNVDPLKIDFGKQLQSALDSGGFVTGPVGVLEEQLKYGFFEGPDKEKNTISGWALARGAILSPFIQQFSNTLVSELMTRWLKNLWGVKTPCDIARQPNKPGSGGPDIQFTGSLLCASSDINDYLNEGSGSGYGGSYTGDRNAGRTYASLLKPKIEIGGEYDSLGEMIICPDENPGINNCVMSQQFGQAVLNQLTVQEAVQDYGYIDGAAPFGYTSPQGGTEPNYQQGIGASNIQKMRRARIVPVGWELAAEIIRRQAVNTQLNNVYSLSTLMTDFTVAGENDICDGFDAKFETATDDLTLHLIDKNDSLFCGLVDPHWVLKAPQQRCEVEAPGELYLGGNLRQTYCAKTQDCILEEADGGCRAWGQCVREKNIWWFDGQECPNYYDTCQTFQAASSDTEISVRKDSVSYAGCSTQNDGCSAYAWNKTTATGDWSTDFYQYGPNAADQASDFPYFLDNEAAACTDAAAGCSEFIRSFSGSGTNLMRNGSFEQFGAATGGALVRLYGWDYLPTSGATLSTADVWLGSAAVGLTNNTVIAAVAPAGSAVGSRTFTLSFATKNCTEQSAVVFGSTSNTDSVDVLTDIHNAYSTTIQNLLAAGTDIGEWQVADMLQWGRYSLVYTFPDTVSDANTVFTFTAKGTGCLVDAVQVEEGNAVGSYAEYGSSNLTYLKQAPSYLGCNGSTFQPAECANYAPVCSAQDVGCQEYTALLDGTVIPGQIIPSDSCPASCVGYSTYRQEATHFASQQFPLYFIASSGEQCSAQDVGCQEFTNLDTVSGGGEGVENYSFLSRCQSSVVQAVGHCDADLSRQCSSNSDCAGGDSCNFSVSPDCAPFYTWEGSEETGYRLQLFSLKENPASTATPFVINQFSYINPDPNSAFYGITQIGFGGDPYSCEPFYGKNSNEVWYNDSFTPNCRQFYSAGGDISYRIVTDTVVCSESCHPYRLTGGVGRDIVTGAVNADCRNSGGLYSQCRLVAIANGQPSNTVVPIPAQSCAAAGGVSYNGLCYNLSSESSCNTFGTSTAAAQWDNFNGQCRYLGEPASSIACDTPGCREYRGNYAAASRVLFNDGFDGDEVNTQVSAWDISTHTGNTTYTGTVVGESYSVGGHSYRTSNQTSNQRIARWLGDETESDPALVRSGRVYSLSFWARAAAPTTADIFFQDGVSGPVRESFADDVSFTANWRLYRFGPVPVTNPSSLLVFDPAGTGAFYIDNVRLEEVNDTQFLVADSWSTPAECDQNQAGAPAPQFMLGCAAYRNSGNQIDYLRSFNRLCQPGSVGCEALIDTQNSSSPWYQQYWRECSLASACTTVSGCDCATAEQGVVCEVLEGAQSCRYILTNETETALPAIPIPDSPITADEPYQVSTVPVPADGFVYLVNKPEYRCAAADKGCQALGQVPYSKYLEQSGWNIAVDATFAADDNSTRYLKNTPDQYETITCQRSELWCDAFSSDNANTPVLYFRNPGGQGCEYRVGATGVPAWYVKDPVAAGTDVPCEPTSYDPNRVNFYPAQYCTDEFSGCSQFFDPAGSSQNNSDQYYYVDNASIRRDECRTGASLKEGCALFMNNNKVNWQEYTGQIEDDLRREYSTSNAAATYAKSEAAQFTPVSPINCEQPIGDEAQYCPTPYNTTNDLVKVRRDRVCAEWIDCAQKQTWTDPATGQKAEVCFVTNSCTKFTAIEDSTQPLYYCAQTDENPLAYDYTEAIYRDTTPDVVENPADGLPVPTVAPACDKPGVPCVNADGEGMFRVADNGYSRAMYNSQAAVENPLIINKYLNRSMDWMNGYEYSGYSIPYLRPVWSLDELPVGRCVTETFNITAGAPSAPAAGAPAADISATFGGWGTLASGCISDADCASGKVCNFSEVRYRLGYRLVDSGQEMTRQAIGSGSKNIERSKSCRAYPELDAPFSRYVEGNPVFTGVNLCGQVPDDSKGEYCDCHYQKLVFDGSSSYVTFLDANRGDDVALAGGTVATECNDGVDNDDDGDIDLDDDGCSGPLDNSEKLRVVGLDGWGDPDSKTCPGEWCVCSEVDGSTGLKVGDLCNWDQDCEAESKEPKYIDQTIVDGTVTSVQYDRGGLTPTNHDVCVQPQEVQKFLGWKGYCLEYSKNINVENNTAHPACLTWMPIDLLRGEGNTFLADPGADYTAIEGLNEDRDLWYCLREQGNYPYRQLTSSNTDRVESLDGCTANQFICTTPDDSEVWNWDEWRPEKASETVYDCENTGTANDGVFTVTEGRVVCVPGLPLGQTMPQCLATGPSGDPVNGHWEMQSFTEFMDRTWVEDGDIRLYAVTGSGGEIQSSVCGKEFEPRDETRLKNTSLQSIEALVFEEQGCMLGSPAINDNNVQTTPKNPLGDNTHAVVFIPDKKKREMYLNTASTDEGEINYICDDTNNRIFSNGWETCWPKTENNLDSEGYAVNWREYAFSYLDRNDDGIADKMVFNREIGRTGGIGLIKNIDPENIDLASQNSLKIVIDSFNGVSIKIGILNDKNTQGSMDGLECPGTEAGRNVEGAIILRPIIYYNEQCTAFAQAVEVDGINDFSDHAAPWTNRIWGKTYAVQFLNITFEKHSKPYGSSWLSGLGGDAMQLKDGRYIFQPPTDNEIDAFPNAGTPYSCANGTDAFCGKQQSITSTIKIGEPVSGASNDFSLTDNQNNSNDVRKKLGELFAKSFHLYEWFGGNFVEQTNKSFDYRKAQGTVPKVVAALMGTEAGTVAEGVVGPSINFRDFGTPYSSSGPSQQPLIIASGYTQVAIRFFGYNDNGEQMPIRNIGIDWDGDGFEPGENGDRYISDSNLDAFANRQAECTGTDYGDSPQACKAEYYELIGYYVFDPSASTYQANCNIQIANPNDPNYIWNGYTGPCNRIRPAVQVVDNWGVCGSGCSNGVCLYDVDPSGADTSECQSRGWVKGGELILLGDEPNYDFVPFIP